MILKNRQFLKENWPLSVSHLWLSPPFSVLVLNFSRSYFPLQLFPLVSLALWSFFSPIHSNLLLPSLFCFPPPPPQSAELSPLTLLTLSTLALFRPLPFPRCLSKVLGPTTCLSFELRWKQGTRDSARGGWTLPTPWFQVCRESCCRWYEGKLALPHPEHLSPTISAGPSHGPETSYFWWRGILGAYGWVIPCSWNDLTTLCLLCHQEPQNSHVFAEGGDHSHVKFACQCQKIPPPELSMHAAAGNLFNQHETKQKRSCRRRGKWAEPFLLTKKAPSLKPASSANKGWWKNT